jgi:toxin ParE1/3/4
VRIRLLRRAIRDLDEVYAYIAAGDPRAAAGVAKRLAVSLKLIGERPDIGRPTKWTNVREWSVPDLPYVIPYRVRNGVIDILRIWHTSRNRPENWRT